jgi:hypothetical protein
MKPKPTIKTNGNEDLNELIPKLEYLVKLENESALSKTRGAMNTSLDLSTKISKIQQSPS